MQPKWENAVTDKCSITGFEYIPHVYTCTYADNVGKFRINGRYRVDIFFQSEF